MSKKSLLLFVSTGAAIFIGIAVALAESGDLPPDTQYDAIIVLGCRVLPSGQPSYTLTERAKKGGELWQDGRAPIIFTTGGVGTHPPSEAKASADVLRKMGVVEEKISEEDQSTSTEENAKFVQKTLGPHARVVIVTDRYHTFRAKRVFQRYFDSVDAVGVDGRYPHVLWSASREIFAIVYYAVRGRL